MNISGIKLQPELLRHRIYKSITCSVRRKLWREDKKLFKVRSVDLDCPLSNIIPKKKEIKYQLRNKTAYRPEIKTHRLRMYL